MYSEKTDSAKKMKFAQFERSGSTYKHRICRYNGDILIGYSKPAGQAEPFAHDKTLLLRAVLRRLLINNGYLKTMQWMEIYRITSLDEKDDFHIVTLMPNGYRFSPAMLHNFSKAEMQPLADIFNEFYMSSLEFCGVENPEKPKIQEILGLRPDLQPQKTQQPKDRLPNLDTMMSKPYIAKISSWEEFTNIVHRMRSDKRFAVGEVNAFIAKAIDNNPKLQK